MLALAHAPGSTQAGVPGRAWISGDKMADSGRAEALPESRWPALGQGRVLVTSTLLQALTPSLL